MQKNRIFILVACIIIFLGVTGYFLVFDSPVNLPIENKTEASNTPLEKTNAASLSIKEEFQKKSEFDSTCANLPNEIDPADDKLMQLSIKCRGKDDGNKENYIKLPPFHMPDTSWAERKINFKGKIITYKFGEGNPTEVSLKPEDYNGSHGTYEDYVTPEVEKNLSEFLSNPSLKNLIDKCGSVLGRDAVDVSIPLIQNSSAILDGQEISMEKMLQIDEKTGRKYIDYARIIALNGAFNKLNSPLSPSEHEKLKYQCLNSYDLPELDALYQQFSRVTKNYINTTDGYSASDSNNPDYNEIKKYKQFFGK